MVSINWAVFVVAMVSCLMSFISELHVMAASCGALGVAALLTWTLQRP